jgi:hypothetical protein
LVAAALLAVQPHLLTPAYTETEPAARDVVIRRDGWGVPNILAAIEADAAHGVARAQTEDDFEKLQHVLMRAKGRAGELDGVSGAATDYVRALFGVAERVEARYSKDFSGDGRAIAEGYAASLNRYAAKHPGEVIARGLCSIEGRDLVADRLLGAPFFFGMDHVLEALLAGTPLPVDGGPLTDRWLERLCGLAAARATDQPCSSPTATSTWKGPAPGGCARHDQGRVGFRGRAVGRGAAAGFGVRQRHRIHVGAQPRRSDRRQQACARQERRALSDGRGVPSA